MEYLSEEELKAEIAKVQTTQRLQRLYKEKEMFEGATYTWEKQELQEIINEIKELEANGASKDYSLDKFGSMILLLLKRIMSRHNFSGYTWKDDFYSDAIEKILKYLHNFNPNLTSKITGQPVKAFAYLTQIAMHSFISVINSHKDEIEMMKQMVPLMSQENDRHSLSQYRANYYESQENETTEVEFEVDIDIREQTSLPFQFNDTEYNSVLDLVKDTFEVDKNYKLTMHKSITIPLNEYESIIALNTNSKALNITRFQHKNSFPKKKSTKVTVEEKWFNELGIDINTEIDVVENSKEDTK